MHIINPIIFEQIVANIKLLALYTIKLIIFQHIIIIPAPKLNVACVKLPIKVQIITNKYISSIFFF